VNLPSGGSIVIEPTEGMTAIDVNSGRLVREANPEDLALKTNLEAAREIMRQLRLRDLGGIIVIDFIDMKQERHKRELENEVREESRRDRSQMVILPLSQFCLLEIARQKTRPEPAGGLERSLPGLRRHGLREEHRVDGPLEVIAR
jgi:Rne/Rng family ribonuclease